MTVHDNDWDHVLGLDPAAEEKIGELYDRLPAGAWVDLPEYGVRVRRFADTDYADHQYGQLGTLPFTRSLVPTAGATRTVRPWHTADACASQAETLTVPTTIERLDRVMPDTSGTEDVPEKAVYTRTELDHAVTTAVRRIVDVMADQQEHAAIQAVYRAAAEVGVSTEDPFPPVDPEEKRPVPGYDDEGKPENWRMNN